MRFPSLLLLATLLPAGAIFAQGPPPPGMPGQGMPQQGVPGGDPPSRVARLNFIDGNVSYQPSGLDSWAAASLNFPLTSGDHIYSDVGAHAEMHIGPNALRLGSQSNFGFLNLDDRTVQVRFTEGALEIRLRQLADDDVYEVDTPQGAISLLRNGEYRIETDPNRNATMVTVTAGDAEVTANGNSFAVHPRQTAFFADGAQPDIREANPPDAFDQFTSQRNMLEDRIPPPLHVPPTMAGYQDLDAYGVWRNEPGYGWVWVPRVRAGWAPYHEGHWAWVAPWGWTWIDDAPWGFAPFHYGRWAYLGGVWVWAPGAVVARPVYAPALVAFVGGESVRSCLVPARSARAVHSRVSRLIRLRSTDQHHARERDDDQRDQRALRESAGARRSSRDAAERVCKRAPGGRERASSERGTVARRTGGFECAGGARA